MSETFDRKDEEGNISCRKHGIVSAAGAVELASSGWMPPHLAQQARRKNERVLGNGWCNGAGISDVSRSQVHDKEVKGGVQWNVG